MTNTCQMAELMGRFGSPDAVLTPWSVNSVGHYRSGCPVHSFAARTDCQMS